MQLCETCPAVHPIEDMRLHGEVWLCPKCSGDAEDAFRKCAHDWRPETDEFGDPSQSCSKCGGLVPDDQFEEIMGAPLPNTQLSS
jgi:hypothetical protein